MSVPLSRRKRPRIGLLDIFVGPVEATAGARVYKDDMTEGPEDWSPADHPYAIAVSEARWWLSTVQVAAGRLDDGDDVRAFPMSSRQIDARHLVLALSQLLKAEHLEQLALDELQMDSAVKNALREVRSAYLEALPGLLEMRNALTHFEDWSRGQGHGPQRLLISGGQKQRDVARDYWGFGYDASIRIVRLGPYRIEIDGAVRAATHLHRAIYAAARAVDERTRGASEP